MRFTTLLRCAAATGCAGLASPCSAQVGVLDQESPSTTAGFNISEPHLVWQQQVRAGIAGQLEGVVLTVVGEQGAQAAVRLRVGPAWATALPAFETMLTKGTHNPEPVFVDMTAAAVHLTAGELFVIETQGNGTGLWLTGSIPELSGPPGYPEPLWLSTEPFLHGWQHGFHTYMLTQTACYPNCDGSMQPPVLNVDDFTCFINEFAAASALPHAQHLTHYANCDHSTTAPVLNVDDFTCFIDAFAQGCL